MCRDLISTIFASRDYDPDIPLLGVKRLYPEVTPEPGIDLSLP
jgi:hypothetical protein